MIDDFLERRKDDEVNDDGEDSVNGILLMDDFWESRKDDEVNDEMKIVLIVFY